MGSVLFSINSNTPTSSASYLFDVLAPHFRALRLPLVTQDRKQTVGHNYSQPKIRQTKAATCSQTGLRWTISGGGDGGDK